MYIHCSSGVLWDVRFEPSQLSCLGSSAGSVFCLECGVLWIRVPPEAAHFSLEKLLPWVCCVVCLTLLASFFLPSLSLINMYNIVRIYTCAYMLLYVRMYVCMLLYAGTVYLPQEPLFFQSLRNTFIFRCADGVMIDGNHRGLSKWIYK